MSGFTSNERLEVDVHYKALVSALHALDPAHPPRLKTILATAESAPTEPTLARVLVAKEILRGIASKGRGPLAVRDYALAAALSDALAKAEQFGRDLSPNVLEQRRGLLSLFSRQPKMLSRQGREALMHCRAIGASQERRAAGSRAGKAVRRA